jgi:hypothetical protein
VLKVSFSRHHKIRKSNEKESYVLCVFFVAEKIDVTYSYWDGSGHRRTITVTKGTSIDRFLDLVRQEFNELRNINVENLMFIKEDLIIPHVSFIQQVEIL